VLLRLKVNAVELFNDTVLDWFFADAHSRAMSILTPVIDVSLLAFRNQ